MKSNKPLFPESWQSKIAADCFLQISTTHKKVKTKDCNETGAYPVIDQGQASVAGYIDDPSKVIEVDSPLCVFGDHTRAVKWVDSNFVPGADGTKVLQPLIFLFPRFAYHQLRNMEIPDKGYSRHFKFFKELWFGIPPLAEQKVIAEKLDTLLAQVEATKARLESTLQTLKQFRQSVLAAAVSGKLTEDWRTKHSAIDAKAEIHTLHTKRKEYFANLGKKDKPLKRQTNTVSLNSLPSSWSYSHIDPFLSLSRVGMKTGPFGSLLKKNEHVTSGIPVLGIENIGSGEYISGSKIHITPEKAEYLKGYDVVSGDIVISRSGTVGDVCVIPDDVGEARFSTNIMRLSVMSEHINPHYLGWLFLGSPIVLDQVAELCKGSTRLFLNQKILSSIKFPIAPLQEQEEIVLRINKFFAGADATEQQVNQALERVNNLTQSVLAKAFRGELTEQWRKDNSELISGENSAEALLEKIKAEGAAANPKRKTRKKAE